MKNIRSDIVKVFWAKFRDPLSSDMRKNLSVIGYKKLNNEIYSHIDREILYKSSASTYSQLWRQLYSQLDNQLNSQLETNIKL